MVFDKPRSKGGIEILSRYLTNRQWRLSNSWETGCVADKYLHQELIYVIRRIINHPLNLHNLQCNDHHGWPDRWLSISSCRYSDQQLLPLYVCTYERRRQDNGSKNRLELLVTATWRSSQYFIQCCRHKLSPIVGGGAEMPAESEHMLYVG